jgi:hypothetical protein
VRPRAGLGNAVEQPQHAPLRDHESREIGYPPPPVAVRRAAEREVADLGSGGAQGGANARRAGRPAAVKGVLELGGRA